MVDSLMKEIETNAQLKKDFAAIVRYMEMLSDRILLPKEKFRHIESDERSDLFEFKKGILRIYVIKQKPDVYVVCGGLKTNQKKDIQSFKKKIKDFKTI